MIEFYGTLSDKCLKWFCRRTQITSSVASGIVAVVCAILACIFYSRDRELFGPFLATAILFVMLLPSLLSPTAFNSSVQRLRQTLFGSVIIEQKYIRRNLTLVEQKIRIFKIRKVIDFGDWYLITFRPITPSANWICEKKLLVRGTLEEFENFFAKKLVRKLPKENPSPN